MVEVGEGAEGVVGLDMEEARWVANGCFDVLRGMAVQYIHVHRRLGSEVKIKINVFIENWSSCLAFISYSVQNIWRLLARHSQMITSSKRVTNTHLDCTSITQLTPSSNLLL